MPKSPGKVRLQPKGNDKRGFVIRSVFEDAYNYMKSGHLAAKAASRKLSAAEIKALWKNAKSEGERHGKAHEQSAKK